MIKLFSLISILIFSISCNLSLWNNEFKRESHEVMPGIDIKVIDKFDYLRRFYENNVDFQSYVKIMTTAINGGNYTKSGEIDISLPYDEYIFYYTRMIKLLFKRVGYIVNIKYDEVYPVGGVSYADPENNIGASGHNSRIKKRFLCTIMIDE